MIMNVLICLVSLEWCPAHSKRPVSVSYYCHASLSQMSSNNVATRAAESDGKSMRFGCQARLGLNPSSACLNVFGQMAAPQFCHLQNEDTESNVLGA